MCEIKHTHKQTAVKLRPLQSQRLKSRKQLTGMKYLSVKEKKFKLFDFHGNRKRGRRELMRLLTPQAFISKGGFGVGSDGGKCANRDGEGETDRQRQQPDLWVKVQQVVVVSLQSIIYID